MPNIIQPEKITDWISAGDIAVAIQVDVRLLPERPGEFFLTPETVRKLEQVRRDVEAKNIEVLKKVGKVYQLLETASGN